MYMYMYDNISLNSPKDKKLFKQNVAKREFESQTVHFCTWGNEIIVS